MASTGLLAALKLPPAKPAASPGGKPGDDAAARKSADAAKKDLEQAWAEAIDFAKGVKDVPARGELLGKLKSVDLKRQQSAKAGDPAKQAELMQQAIAEIRQAREATQERSDAVPRAEAQKLRDEVQKNFRQAHDAHAVLEEKQKALKARADAADAAGKKQLAGEQAALEKQLKAAEHRRDQAFDDANALDNPETKREQYLAILGRQKSGAGIASYTEIDKHETDRKLPGEKHVTRTTTALQGGVVQVDKTDSKRTVGFDGVTQTDSREREVQSADQTLRSSQETKTSVSLQGKVTREEKKKSEIEHADGRKLSVEDAKETELGLDGAKRTNTRTVTRGDGSSTATSRTASVERGDGKVGVGGEQSTTRTDAAGNEKKQSLSAKGGAIAGDGGYGGYGSGKGSLAKQGPGGLKAGAVGGLSGAATCVIGEPAGDPPRWPVKTTVRIGASLGASGGHEKKGGESKGSLEVEAQAEVVFEQTHQLEAGELATYLDAVRAADKGGKVAGTWKELTILSAGVSQGLEAARRAMGGKTKLADQVGAREGESATLSDSESVGGKAGADIKAVKLGVEGKKSQSHATTATRDKQGNIEAASTVGAGESLSGTAGIGMGVVEGEAGRSHSLETAMGYRITIDAAQDPDGALLQEFHACRDPAAQEAFIAKYEKTQRIKVKGKTTSRKEKDGDTVALSVAKVKLQLGSEHGTEQERETDGDGKLVRSTVKGSNKSGGKFGIGKASIGDSGTAEATSTRSGEGDATLDVTDTKSSTNLKKLARKLVGMDAEDDPDKKKKKTGLIADAAGSKKDEDAEEAETQDRDDSGINLGKGDLQRIVAIAKGDPARWSACVERLADYDAWVAVGRRVASGDAGAAGDALAEFVGSGSSSRRQIVENLVRPQGNISMATRADFPESMKQWKKPYQELVVEACEARLAETAKKENAAAAGTLGQKLFEQLGDLLKAVSASKAFVRPGVQAEMISAINDRKTKLLAAMRSNAGANTGAGEAKAENDEYERLMSECASYKTLENAPMERIRALLGNRPRVIVRDAVEAQKLIHGLDDLYAVWNRDYAKVEVLGKKIGKPATEYAAKKPDLSGLPKLKWACWSK